MVYQKNQKAYFLTVDNWIIVGVVEEADWKLEQRSIRLLQYNSVVI